MKLITAMGMGILVLALLGAIALYVWSLQPGFPDRLYTVTTYNAAGDAIERIDNCLLIYRRTGLCILQKPDGKLMVVDGPYVCRSGGR